MLTGSQIKKEIEDGGIVISPFNEDQLNPNSYNMKLSSKLLYYTLKKTDEDYDKFVGYLDSSENNEYKEINVPDTGLILKPGVLYLGSTFEWTESHSCIPMINGRSSLARLGLVVHQTGGFGDLGFKGNWTLEFSCIHPVKIYPNMEICQVCWFYPFGSLEIKYNGKYQGQDKPIPSKFFTEYKGINNE